MGSHLALARGGVRVPFAWPCLLFFAFFLLFGTLAPQRAHAFCRESTTSAPGGDCNNTASSILLFWDRNCMTYEFHSNAFARVPMGESFVRNTFATSFQTWANVPCSGTQTPFLVAQASGSTSTLDAEFLYNQPNESVVLLRNRGEWRALPDHDALALALTLIWHDKKTGEILDVDMELNGGAGTFTDCEATSCGNTSIDLRNTVTHEAGHLLGLGHSNARGATMQPSTTMSPEVEKRDLAPDDTAGYCALELPDGPCAMGACTCPAPPVYSSQRTVRACSCRTLGARPDADSSSRLWGMGLAGVVLGSMWLRRRKSRSLRS
jgi:hypothetical protein